ncbi:MAG: shikimate kinase [Clostridia bacterium]|nr:shikimate kinase [Clostridia bacterium]
MNNIVLIGMPGAGKSTVGVILAKRLGYSFIDTDLLIIKKMGKTLPEILSEVDVASFLEIEGQIGESVRCEKCVIATGGSMVFSGAAMNNLREGSVVIWLDTKVDELERRVSAAADRGIAAQPGTTIADIDAVRRPLYEKYADIHINCRDGTDNVVSQIREALV